MAPMDLTVYEIWTRLASNRRVNVPPFITTPVNTSVIVYRDGTCGGEWGGRTAPPSEIPFRIRKGQAVSWYGQPMRVKGGPVIKRVKDFRKHPTSTVYTVGRGRQRIDVQVTELAPLNASVARTLFKGVIWPLGHAT